MSQGIYDSSEYGTLPSIRVTPRETRDDATPAGAASRWSPLGPVSFAWRLIKADPITIVGGLVLGLIPSGAAGWPLDLIAGASSGGGAMFWRVAATIANWVMSAFMLGGITRFCLKIGRGERYSFGDLFEGRATFFPILIAELLLAIGTSVGLVLLVFPGVIFALGMSLTIPLIVDRGLDPLAAMTASWQMAIGQKRDLFAYAILMLLLSLVGVLACGIGVLLVLAMGSIGQAFIYLKLSERAEPA